MLLLRAPFKGKLPRNFPFRYYTNSSNSESKPPEESKKCTIYFDNLFPLSSSIADIRYILARKYANEMRESGYKDFFPVDQLSADTASFVAATPNIKEGGMFVTVNYKDITESEIVEKVTKYLAGKDWRSMYNFQPIRAYAVKGTPFMEDMVGRLPSRRIRVEFDGPDLSLESLYRTLRVYGRIVDIVVQPSSSKDTPRYAIVQFAWVRSASAARNCAHGQVIKGTRISISYEKTLGFIGTILKWMKDHPRLMIPILLGLLAGTTYLVFDPIRVWFISNKITSRFSMGRLKERIYKHWLGITEGNSFINNMFSKQKDRHEDWEERIKEERRLLSALNETPNTLTLVYGPRGSGKSDMIGKVQRELRYHLTIDCDELINIPEHEMLTRLSSQVGFYPQLNFLVSSSSIIDTLIAATTGAKANFTTTYEAQVRKILETLTLALTRMSIAQNRHNLRSDDKNNGQTQDTTYPVIFVEGFMSKERARNDYIYDMLATWAATIEENRLGHVVFVSNNPGAIKTLSKVMPNKPVENIALHDASLSSSLAYVKRRLGLEGNDDELRNVVLALGGRRTDLELFIQKIKAGNEIVVAYQEIVNKSVSELRKLGLGEDDIAGKKTLWTPSQFWKVIQLLSKYEQVDYDELRNHGLFKGNELPIQYMENAGLIAIEHQSGRPKIIRAGRPVYKAAFMHMTSDQKLNAFMGRQVVKVLRTDMETKIKEYEAEMATILQIISGYGATFDGRLVPRESRIELDDRMKYLTMMMGDLQKRVKELTEKEKEYRKILKLKE